VKLEMATPSSNPDFFFAASGSTLSVLPRNWELEDFGTRSCQQPVRPGGACLLHGKAFLLLVSA